MMHALPSIVRTALSVARPVARPVAAIAPALALTMTLTMTLALALPAAPAFAQDRPVALVSDGIANARIVIADEPDQLYILPTKRIWIVDASHTTRYAAEFLQDYVKLATGVEIPIITVSQARSEQQRPLILVGRSELTEFVEEDRARLDPEGYIVRRHGNHVAIVGEFSGEGEDVLLEQHNLDRGTLFGVYEFLEEVLGVRWYFPGTLGVIIPEVSTWTLPDELDLTAAPAFKMRASAVRDIWRAPGEEVDPAVAFFDSAHPVTRQGNTTGFMSNHSSNDWHRYVEDHPEVFAVDEDGVPQVDPDGYGSHKVNHLNYLHPKTLEIDLQRVQDFYERGIRYWSPSIAPNSKYVRFFPRDLENIYHDRSPEAQALWTPDRENSKLSEIIHGYAAKFARELKKLYPDKRLAFGAYSGFLQPPLSVEFPDNADVMIATLKGNSKLVSPAHWQHNVDVVNAWYDALGQDRTRLYLWEYFIYPNHRIAFYPHTMQRWFQFCETRVNGAFNNMHSLKREDKRDHVRLSYINGWFWHRLLWNPDMDVDAALEQMYADLFGPAQEPMGDLIDLCIDAYENAPWGPRLNPGAVSFVHRRFLYRHVYGPEFVVKARELLAAAREAAPEGSTFAQRVEFFGESIEAELDDAEAFQKNDKNPPQTRVPQVDQAPDLQAMLDQTPTDVPALELHERRVGGDAKTLSPSQVFVSRLADDLLITARLSLREAGAMRSEGAFRDDPQILRDDHFAVDLGVHERVLGQPDFYYRVVVNPAGRIADGLAMVPIVIENRHWDAWLTAWSPTDIEVATAIDDAGWSLAMRLPLSVFPELAREPRDAIAVQFSQHLTVGDPMARTLTWSPMFVEPYEYDLKRMGTLVLN